MNDTFETHRQLHYWRRRLRHVDAEWAPALRAMVVWLLKQLSSWAHWSPKLRAEVDLAVMNITTAMYGVCKDMPWLEVSEKGARANLKYALEEVVRHSDGTA